MKRKLPIIAVALIIVVSMVALAACDVLGNTGIGTGTSTDSGTVTTVDTTSTDSTNTGVDNSTTTAEAVTDSSVSATETNADFIITVTSETGHYTVSGSTYTIDQAGTYTLSGYLEGQILVEATDDDTVVLELEGVTIVNSTDSPIKVTSADKVEISAKSGTENVIKDTRSAKTTDTDTLGEGAIYAKADLKLKGQGTLVVTAGYNNGIHTTKDLTIQKLSLKVTAYNNALKGNDSVTVKSGTVVAISTHGDGIKTENTDADKKGNMRGDVTIEGGSVVVYAAGDGIQTAHDFLIDAPDDTAPSLTIYTGSYSGYTASNAATTSYKGVKAQNQLTVAAGSVTIHSYDDGLHCDYGTTFEAGGTGQGTINVTGGTINVTVYAPTSRTMGGRMGPGGWGGQQTVKGADAIHADYKLNISGGTITIDSAYEGLEANVITISGGTTYVAGSDDGVNACSGPVKTPQVNVTGGYLDVTVSPSGDTDGIDSNGTYTQSGGIVITRGPNSQMMAALDSDGTATITGGTIIILGALGERGLTKGSGVSTYSLSLHSAGSHTVTIDGTRYTFNNASSYGRTYCYSSVSVSA